MSVHLPQFVPPQFMSVSSPSIMLFVQDTHLEAEQRPLAQSSPIKHPFPSAQYSPRRRHPGPPQSLRKWERSKRRIKETKKQKIKRDIVRVRVRVSVYTGKKKERTKARGWGKEIRTRPSLLFQYFWYRNQSHHWHNNQHRWQHDIFYQYSHKTQSSSQHQKYRSH